MTDTDIARRHLDLTKAYSLSEQIEIFERVINEELPAEEMLTVFNTMEQLYDTPLLILYLNQFDYYSCENILTAISKKLEKYFRKALNHPEYKVKSEQANRLLFSITDPKSNREILRLSLADRKFAIAQSFPKNNAEFRKKNEQLKMDYDTKTKQYLASIDYLKREIQAYEESPYDHLGEVKELFSKKLYFKSLQKLLNKSTATEEHDRKYRTNIHLLDIMHGNLAKLMLQEQQFERIEEDHQLIKALRLGINKTLITASFEEVDYKYMYKK